MGKPLSILLVEDSEDDAALVVMELRRGGYDPTVERVDTYAAMSTALDQQGWDVIISDYSMPHFNGLAALALVQKKGLDLPFIIMSGTIGEEIAVEAMRAGAHDYIMKNNMTRLGPAIERELREAKIRQERKQAEEMTKYMAYYDLLTALPNRTLLQNRIERAIVMSQRDHRPVALLLMDLDGFKEINDTLGHSRGDLLLQQVGARLQQALRESDTVARLGGDEFAVLLPLASPDHGRFVAKKIMTALEPPFSIEELPIVVEASIGIAIYPDHGETAEALVQRADVAMYVAKHTKNSFTMYSPELDQHSPRRLALMGQLREAIGARQLFLHYQPVVDMRSNRILGVEALVRWQHPEHGLIPPDQFIGPAEQTGLIGPLTRFVLQEAATQCQAWQRAGVPLRTSVNLSARNLHDPGFSKQVAEIVDRCGINPACLEFEITESAIMMNPAFAMEVLAGFNRMGIALAIDDFGTGYTSLGQLKKLPVQTIKIDKSFVLGMLANNNDHTIVRSIIDLSHDLGFKVVAEGVETHEVWDQLAALGCDIAQGYHISRPMPASDLSRWLNESPWGPDRAAATQ
jgi:diguanylate cyclase (GGDEF)-like protein